MAKQQSDLLKNIRHIVLRISRVHFLYLLAYLMSVIIFDSWNLLAKESVIERWTAAGAFIIVNAIIWYLCRAKLNIEYIYKIALAVLIGCGILFAAANIYWTRGMASKYVFLFAVPIISAGLSRSRSLLITTSAVSAATYSIVAVQYFNENYGQGVRAELYGEIIFFSSAFFILAGLMMIGFRKAAD